MALQTTLTGDQLTAIRSGRYQAFQFVCVVPNEVVVQFNPSVAPSTAVYAEITVGSIASGSMANIRQAQTVIFSTTADYQATEVFRTRVRKVSGTTILYVGENSQSITDETYITVLNTYEIQEKLRKSETLADWDVTFRKLLPIETALPSAVVLTNDVVAYSPTATPKAMDASATSSFTHAWESSNSSDTLDSGGTTNNPTFTLEAGAFRWIRYTFTDSNGNSNFRVIPVFTVPKDYSTAVASGFVSESGDVATISFDAELGWSATVTAWDGIEDLINKTFTVIASDEWYNNTRQSIRTNINFVGFLQNESTPTAGNEQAGRISETSFTVEGFGHQLARQNIAPIRITRVSGVPTAWNQIQNPTPARMLTYHLSEGSTLFHLCSMAVPADDTDFVGDDLSITSGKAYDDIRFITEVINSELQFDVNGRLDLCRNLNFLGDTARDTASVVATLSPGDLLDYVIEYDYSKTTASLNMTGGSYNSTSDAYAIFEAIAPAVARLGEGDPLEIVNQVLTTDNTAAESLTEISERASNFFAYNNPTPMLRGTLKDEWYFLVPDIGSWFKFDIALTDTARGRTLGVDDRWQLVEMSYSSNSLTGRRQVSVAFRHETQSTGAIIRARQILNNTNADIIYYPPVIAPFVGEDLTYTDGRYFDGVDVQPPSEPNPAEEDCENGGFRVRDGFYETTSIASNNEYVGITVRGSGRIDLGGAYSCVEFDFATDDGGFVALNGSTYNGAGYWDGEESIPFPATSKLSIVDVRLTLPSTAYVLGIGIVYDATHQCGITSGGASVENSGVHVGGFATSPVSSGNPGRTWGLSTPGTYYTGNQIRVTISSRHCDGSYPDTRLFKVRVWLHEDSPYRGESVDAVPYGTGAGGTVDTVWWDAFDVADVYGDAFYYWEGETPSGAPTPHSDGFGLLVEGFSPTSIPPYDVSHQYELDPMQVNSGPVDFTYEPEFGSSGLSNWSLQLSTCFQGQNP